MSYFKYLFAKSRTEELNKTVENMTNSITRGFLERKVEILEKELGETNQAIQDIIELEKTEDDRVFKNLRSVSAAQRRGVCQNDKIRTDNRPGRNVLYAGLGEFHKNRISR